MNPEIWAKIQAALASTRKALVFNPLNELQKQATNFGEGVGLDLEKKHAQAGYAIAHPESQRAQNERMMNAVTLALSMGAGGEGAGEGANKGLAAWEKYSAQSTDMSPTGPRSAPGVAAYGPKYTTLKPGESLADHDRGVLAAKMLGSLQTDGGFTMNAKGAAANKGYAVGGGTESNQLLKMPLDQMTPDHIANYLKTTNLKPGELHGGWVKDGMAYVEPSQPVMDLNEAQRLGNARGEQSIWDHANSAEIPLKAGKALAAANSPMAQHRDAYAAYSTAAKALNDELTGGQLGRDVLAAKKNPDWLHKPGGAATRYGEGDHPYMDSGLLMQSEKGNDPLDVPDHSWQAGHDPEKPGNAALDSVVTKAPWIFKQHDIERPVAGPNATKKLADIEDLSHATLTGPRFLDYLNKGRGGGNWYNDNTKVIDKATEALGPTEGPAAFNDLMGHMGASTAMSQPGNNLRRASMYRALKLSGQLDPAELRTSRLDMQPGFGHIANKAHQTATADYAETGQIATGNPKPAGFTQNLMLNGQPYTNDTRNAGGLLRADPRMSVAIAGTPTNPTPRLWAYGAMEKGAQRAAGELQQSGALDPVPAGIAPTSTMQAQGWKGIGVADANRMTSPDEGTFSNVFDKLLHRTAQMWGVPLDEANRLFWQGHPFDLPLNKDLLAGPAIPRR